MWEVCDKGLEVLMDSLPMDGVKSILFDVLIEVVVDLLIADLTERNDLLSTGDQTIKCVAKLRINIISNVQIKITYGCCNKCDK